MPIAVDDTLVRANALATTVTSGSFTPSVGQLVIACTIGSGSAAANPTVAITNTGGGLSAWTQIAIANNTTAGGTEQGFAAIHWATVNSSVATTVTATQTAGTADTNLKIYRVSSYNSITANFVRFHGVGDIWSNPLTTTRADSLVIVCASEWDNTNAPLVPVNLVGEAFSVGSNAGIFGYNIATGVGAVTFFLDANATGAWQYVVWEIFESLPTPQAGTENSDATSSMVLVLRG